MTRVLKPECLCGQAPWPPQRMNNLWKNNRPKGWFCDALVQVSGEKEDSQAQALDSLGGLGVIFVRRELPDVNL